MTRYVREEVSDHNGLYMTASLDADGELNVTTGDIKPNMPYLVSLYQKDGSADVRFVAGACEIPQTPDEICAEGREYTLVGTLSGNTRAAATTYLLSDDGSAFESTAVEAYADIYEENMNVANVTLRPFSVYAVSEEGISSFPIRIDVTETFPTGVTDIDKESSFMVYREGDALIIRSDDDMTIDIVNIAGVRVKTVTLVKGRNVVEDLAHGVYIICGRKVIF